MIFENLTKEIVYLCFIPFIIIVLVDILAFIIMRKKDKKFRFNYFIKVSIIIAIGFVLPLIAGYTAWVIKSFSERNIISSNLWYIILLVVLSIVLFGILIAVYRLSLKDITTDKLENDFPKEEY